MMSWRDARVVAARCRQRRRAGPRRVGADRAQERPLGREEGECGAPRRRRGPATRAARRRRHRGTCERGRECAGEGRGTKGRERCRRLNGRGAQDEDARLRGGCSGATDVYRDRPPAWRGKAACAWDATRRATAHEPTAHPPQTRQKQQRHPALPQGPPQPPVASLGFHKMDMVSGMMRSQLVIEAAKSIREDYRKSLDGLKASAKERLLPEIHRRSAEKLLDIARKNRGIYNKAAQFVCSVRGPVPKVRPRSRRLGPACHRPATGHACLRLV
eukprot:scaffold2740_cov418-Prasinococcus_capsulatus_cf.AAC.18